MDRLTVIVDNRARGPMAAEHGLSICIETRGRRILFDTGAGACLAPNLAAAGLADAEFDALILSHGHNDHTGGAAGFIAGHPEARIFAASGIELRRWVRHPGEAVRELSMPRECREALARRGRILADAFTEILPGVFLTGPIPRRSGEDTGGPFFLDPEGREADTIPEESALLLEDSGTLVTGCCHAGLVNTLEYCREMRPGLNIRRIAGGLHLKSAAHGRLEETVAYLRRNPPEEIVALHCTGDGAAAYLASRLPVPVRIGSAGEIMEFTTPGRDDL